MKIWMYFLSKLLWKGIQTYYDEFKVCWNIIQPTCIICRQICSRFKKILCIFIPTGCNPCRAKARNHPDGSSCSYIEKSSFSTLGFLVDTSHPVLVLLLLAPKKRKEAFIMKKALHLKQKYMCLKSISNVASNRQRRLMWSCVWILKHSNPHRLSS